MTEGPGVDGGLASRLQAALDEQRGRAGVPGAEAAVVFADGSLWSGASGWADVDSRRSVTPHTLFAIASITKTFTMGLALRLVDQGVVSLDDPLSKWDPDFPHADGVTIRELLNNTSGLASLAPSDIAAILRRDPNHRFTDDEVFLSPVCDPGSCYHYQSPNYGLLGRVVEAATGRSLGQEYREQIFGPLGLHESYLPAEEPVRGEVAIGYGKDEFDTAPADVTVTSGPIASTALPPAGGGLVATAADVARFGAGLFGGRLLEPRSLSQTLDFEATRGLPGTDECQAYGLGVVRSGLLGRETWGHGGFSGNFRTDLRYFPREDVTVAVFINDGSETLAQITSAIAETALDRAPVVHPELGRGRCNDDIYSVRADGSDLTRLTSDPATDGLALAWSPDGSRIAFASDRDGNLDVYVMHADGSGPVDLTNDPRPDAPGAWSPDGSRIAFFSYRNEGREIYVMDTEGSNVKQLTKSDDAFLPAWSPDGSRIAYAGEAMVDHDIWVMNADGSNPERLVGTDSDDLWPTWSPDGTRIAFESNGGLVVIQADGEGLARIGLEIGASHPAWGPSGRIAFVSDADIWTVDPDGSNLARLITTETMTLALAWSPDGSHLAFVSRRWEEA